MPSVVVSLRVYGEMAYAIEGNHYRFTDRSSDVMTQAMDVLLGCDLALKHTRDRGGSIPSAPTNLFH